MTAWARRHGRWLVLCSALALALLGAEPVGSVSAPRMLDGVITATDFFRDKDSKTESWDLDDLVVRQMALIRVLLREGPDGWEDAGSEFIVEGNEWEEDYYIGFECLQQGYTAHWTDRQAFDGYDRQIRLRLDEPARAAFLWGSFPAGTPYGSWNEVGSGCDGSGAHVNEPLDAEWAFTMGCPGDPNFPSGSITPDGGSVHISCDGTSTLDHATATNTYQGSLEGTLRFVQ